MKRKHLPVRNQSRGSSLPRVAALLLIAFLSCVGTEAFAYDFTATNDEGVTIYYNYINGSTEAEVTSESWCKGYSGAVIIPATVTVEGSTLKVTKIGEDAFRGCPVTSVAIGDNVTSIDKFAFYNAGLSSVTFGKSVTSIGESAFRGSGLTSITIGGSVTSIGDGAFRGCNCLAEVAIPDNVTSIGKEAFYESGLKSVTIGKGLTTTGDYAFYRCSSLISVTFGDNVTSIGKEAFAGCWELESIIIPDNVTSIGDEAFSDCRKLTSVTIPKNITSIGSAVFWNCGLTSIDIPNTVTSIGDNAFYNCDNLTSVIIPSGLTSIGSSAFQSCSSLTEVTLLGKTLPNCRDYAFSNISSDATLFCAPALGSTCSETEPWNNCFKAIEASIVSLASGERLSDYISDDIKYTVTKLKISGDINGTDIKLIRDMTGAPTSETTCSRLVDLDLTDANIVKGGESYFNNGYQDFDTENNTVGYCFFYYCNLRNVKLPKSVTTINNNAFDSCENLISVNIPENVTSIGSGAFSSCNNLTNINIPYGIDKINASTFQSCWKLTSINIPNSVTNIEKLAFYHCINLTSITIPDSVTSIGDGAFSLCSNLTDVTLGSTLPTCSNNAFNRISANATLYCAPALEDTCSKTTPWSNFSSIVSAVTLADGKRLSDHISTDIKYTVTKLKVVGEVNSDDITLMADMAKNGALSVLDLSGTTAATTDLIGASAFNGCVKLTSISLPDYVTSIGKEAFKGCTGLTSVTIPDGVTSISDNAFEDCSSLASISIPDKVTNIGNYTFKNCSSLPSVTIPDNVTSIGSYAFYNCKGLTSIPIPDDVTSIGEYAFAYCTGPTTIAIPNSVTIIAEHAFYGCSALTSVTIGNSVTSIGEYAFSWCTGLTSVTIPNSVINIADYAFNSCTNLTSVNILDGVTSIGSSAFYGCTKLAEVTLPGKTLPTCATNAFDAINLSNVTLYCKAALIKTCQETEPWKNFGTIKAKPFSVTITDAGVATGCFDDDLDFTDLDVKAYIASGFNPETGKVLMTNVTEVPAGIGFIVKGLEGTYEIPASATKYMYANMLVGTLEDITLSQTIYSYTNYVLGKGADGDAGFYLATDGCVVPTNKAYLQIPTSVVSDGTFEAKALLRLGFDDEDSTTGIIPVANVEEETNGNTVIYNLNGQRKQSLTKGLNIVNGKKILVK